MQIGRYTNFFVNRNEFAVVPVSLRHFQGLAVWCRRHNVLPMINKLSVNRFREIKPVFSRERFTTVTGYRGLITKSQLLETRGCLHGAKLTKVARLKRAV